MLRVTHSRAGEVNVYSIHQIPSVIPVSVCTAKVDDGAVGDFVQFKHPRDSKSTGNLV